MNTKTILILLWAGLALASCKEGTCYYSCCVDETDCETGCAMQTESQDECEEFAAAACADAGLGPAEEVEYKEINTVVCATCDSLGCAPPWWMEASYGVDTDDYVPEDAGWDYDAGAGDPKSNTCHYPE